MSFLETLLDGEVDKQVKERRITINGCTPNSTDKRTSFHVQKFNEYNNNNGILITFKQRTSVSTTDFAFYDIRIGTYAAR